MSEDDLKMVKALVRSVLIGCKDGVSAERFLVDYKDVTGELLPFKKFGFRNVHDFVASIPDVIQVNRQMNGEVKYHAVADETTAHIQKLVSKQRSKKTKRPLKKAPMRQPWNSNRGGGRGGYSRPPFGGPRGQFRPPRPQGPPFQPHYAAIRRYGPQPPRPPMFWPPLLPTPASPEEWSSSPPSSPLGAGEPYQNFQITVRNSGGKPLRPFGNRMIMRAMSDAIHNNQGDNKSNVKFGHKFEIPPRFRKQQDMPNDHVAVFKGDGSDFISKLKDYVRRKNFPPIKFETTQSGGGLYVSSVRVDTRTFGSIDMFSTMEEAEFAAARNALKEVENTQDTTLSTPSSLSVQVADIKEWLKELLEPIPNGMWGTRIPVLFKEKFGEEPPSNFLTLIGTWLELIEVENACGRNLVKLVRSKPTVKWKEVNIPEADLLEPSFSDSVTVYVSFALRVDNFFVQREDSNVDDINAALETECPSLPAPASDLLKTGTCCAALYREDSNWYRAEIMELVDQGESVQVTFVDYGNVETVPVSAVRQLPDDVSSIPAQAIPCALYGILVNDEEKGSDPSPSLKEFSEVVTDSPISALTVAYNTNGQCEVVLTKDELSINLHLLKLDLVDTDLEEWKTQTDQPQQQEDTIQGPDTVILPEEKFLDLYVCFISPDLGVTVRIVGVDYSDKLDEFEEQLEDCFKTASTAASAVSEGQVCVASMDGLYQRVLVNSVTNNKAECYFTDHGDTDTVPLSQLRPLTSEVNSSLPYQAVRCYLHGLERVTDTVTALESLLELALGKTCVAEIVERDERLSVILYDTNDDADININNAVKAAIVANRANQSNTSISSKSDSESKQSPNSKTVNSTFSNNTSERPERQELNRTCSTDSWGTEEEAEALAASYMEATSGSNWESSDIASPDVENSIKKRLAGLSVAADSQSRAPSSGGGTPNSTSPRGAGRGILNSLVVGAVNVSPPHGTGRGILKNISPKAFSQRTSNSSSPQGSETSTGSKGLYTWGSPRQPESQSGVLEPPKQVDIPEIGDFFDVHVLLVSDPTNFWCTPFHMVQRLDDMMKQLNKHFNSSKELVKLTEADMHEGAMYAALVNGAWYRIIVKTVLPKQMVNVYFPDYGSYNVLETSDLQPLPEPFFSLPLCAVKAKLHGVDAIEVNKPWSEAAKYKFLELAADHDLVCLVCDKNLSSGMISVKLVDTSSEQDILLDEVLVDMNYARSLDS